MKQLRYKAVEQETLSFADLGFRFAGRPPRRSGWRYGAKTIRKGGGMALALICAMTETKSTCCYCGVGCGVIIESEDGRITGVRGDPDHPANFGRLCTKGATLHLSAAPETLAARALYPMLHGERVNWDAALDHAAERFAAAIREHGPDSVAFYVSGQLLTEDYYVFNKLAKGLIGTNNIDTNSRLCMSSAVSGYKMTLGADAPPCAYDDIAQTDCLFIAGSNTAWAHPVLFRRIEDAKKANPELKIIVVDPRRTDTAEAADLFLPILPGSDIALYNAMLHVMLWEGLVDNAYIAAHTEGFEALKAIVRDYTPAMAADICGVPAEDIVKAAQWFGAAGKATLSLYCQGLNQSVHGSHNNAALIHLHLATGKIGKPGSGPFSLTGQPNAMGGREAGGMATLLPGHRELANAEHRAEIAELWGVDSVPEAPGLSAVELFDAVHAGKIKALWIACTNPAQSLPEADKVREALARCDFVVVQEAYADTDTTEFAHLLLPASSWGEKEGTVTNSERRISRVCAATPSPGEARADWDIAADFSRRLGVALGRAQQAAAMFPYVRPEQVFIDHVETTRGRDLDITGLSYARLENQGPQQWPFPSGAAIGPDAALRGWRLSHALGPRPLRRGQAPADRRGHRRPLPAAAHHRTTARPVARHEPHRHRRPALQPRARAGARTQRQGHGAAPAQGRRPGAGEEPARRHRPARARQRHAAHRPGIHGHALGPPLHGQRRRQRLDHRRLRSVLQAARTQACGDPGREAIGTVAAFRAAKSRR